MDRAQSYSFSVCGVLLGALLFAASLTPSLLPRTFLTQGVVSGFSLVAGHAIGAVGQWLWTYMELPQPPARIVRTATLAVVVLCACIVAFSLGHAPGWQNSIRELMGLEPVETAYPFKAALIAVAVYAIALALAWIFRVTIRSVATRANRFVSRRISIVIGIAAAVALFWGVINGVLFRVAVGVLDAYYLARDERIEPEREQPKGPLKTGSSASLLDWQELGRAGREFIARGSTREEIAAFSGRVALEPVRVYAGLRSADTPEARAKLALEELKRAGGFERSVLIVITPTGTGWVDPAAIPAVEYLHAGDIASVALQYSYIGSWLYLLTGADYGAGSARALFDEIYEYWTTLPNDRRPRLYLFGISLGAKNSEQSTGLITELGDEVAGALWSGPPHSSRQWRFFTDNRNPGSPAWLPRFRDGSFVRFMNQDGSAADLRAAGWGPVRVVYLQYASDPATFFEYRSLYRPPDWMQSPRGPDVSPQLRWFPVVTLLQLWADKFMSISAPVGFGHVYAPAHYVDAWAEVTDPRGFTAEEIARLKDHLSEP